LLSWDIGFSIIHWASRWVEGDNLGVVGVINCFLIGWHLGFI
jgi:hypothetical protein